MNHVETRPTAPLPLLPGSLRFALAIAVAGLAALAWTGAQDASHEAVQSARMAFAPDNSRITLPSVVIVGHRAAAVAAAAPAGRGV